MSKAPIIAERSRSRIFMAICGLLALFALGLVPAKAAPSTFDEANQLYDQGKFAEAKQRYEQLASAGLPSANLYYNLGNA